MDIQFYKQQWLHDDVQVDEQPAFPVADAPAKYSHQAEYAPVHSALKHRHTALSTFLHQ